MMLAQVQPVLERLMRRVVEEQPSDVVAHFIQILRAAPTEPPAFVNTVDAPIVASVGPAPVPTRSAGHALFRMLDEDSVGKLRGSEIVGRISGSPLCVSELPAHLT